MCIQYVLDWVHTFAQVQTVLLFPSTSDLRVLRVLRVFRILSISILWKRTNSKLDARLETKERFLSFRGGKTLNLFFHPQSVKLFDTEGITLSKSAKIFTNFFPNSRLFYDRYEAQVTNLFLEVKHRKRQWQISARVGLLLANLRGQLEKVSLCAVDNTNHIHQFGGLCWNTSHPLASHIGLGVVCCTFRPGMAQITYTETFGLEHLCVQQYVVAISIARRLFHIWDNFTRTFLGIF